MKFYPDQANREDLANQNGVTGIRSQGTAIVANEGGNFILPAIEIPWWNTLTDSLEYARLPEQTLSVLPEMLLKLYQFLLQLKTTQLKHKNPIRFLQVKKILKAFGCWLPVYSQLHGSLARLCGTEVN